MLQGHAFLCRGNPRCGGGGVGSKVARGATAAVTKPVHLPTAPPVRRCVPRRPAAAAKLRNSRAIVTRVGGWVGGRTGGRPAVLLIIIIIVVVRIILSAADDTRKTRTARAQLRSNMRRFYACNIILLYYTDNISIRVL